MSKISEAKVTCMYCGRDFANADFASALSDVEHLRAHIAKLTEALREIRDTEGKVCNEYEICEHVSCSSSYHSWAIADKALSELEA